MDNLDKRIQEALRSEDRDIFADGDPGLVEMVAGTLRGRLRAFTMLVWGMSLAFVAAQVWSALRFFEAEHASEKVLWATSFLFFAMGVGMLKIWSWMEMQRYAMIREMKRMELQIARLAARMD